MIYKLAMSVYKEFLLLKRDLGGLITLFVMLSAPLTSMLLMRAAVYREKRNEKKREGSSDSLR